MRMMRNGAVLLGLCIFTSTGMPGQTPAPAPDPATTSVIKVGAGANGDDTAAVLAAVASCQGVSHPVLAFEKRDYHFAIDKIPDSKKLVDFQGTDDITVDGNGATLLFAGDVTPLSFFKCHHVTVKNLTIDWPRPPFSQGTAVAATDNSIDIKVDPAYPITGGESVLGMMDYDVDTHLPLANLDIFGSFIASTRLIAPQTLRVTFQSRHNPPKMEHLKKYLTADIGKLFVLRHRVYGQYGVDFDRCSDIHLENITIYTVPGMGLHAGECEDVSSDHVEIRIKPGSGRLMSTTADCQYYTFCRGTVSLDNGYYEGNGDDGLNVTEKYRQVVSLTGPDSLQAGLPTKIGWMGPLPVAGEKLAFCDGLTLEPHGEAVVKSASLDPASKLFHIEFTAPLASEIKATDFFYSEKYLAKAVVRHCTFRGQRSRSMLFSTHDVLVEDCTVQSCGYTGILMKGGDRHGAEGPISQNVTVRNCTFDSCGGAAIYAYGAMAKPDLVSAEASSGFVFEGNTIRQNPALVAQRFARDYPDWVHWSAGICVRGTHDLKITNNSISGYPVAIFLDHVSDAQVSGNHAESAAPLLVEPKTVQQIALDANTNISQTDAGPKIKADLNYLNDCR